MGLEISDALWTKVWPLILHATPDSRPECARPILNALIFRALTQAPWSSLPDVDPSEAEATWRHWHEIGLLDRLAQQMHVRLDDP